MLGDQQVMVDQNACPRWVFRESTSSEVRGRGDTVRPGRGIFRLTRTRQFSNSVNSHPKPTAATAREEAAREPIKTSTWITSEQNKGSW